MKVINPIPPSNFINVPYTMEILNFEAVPCIYHINERRTNWKYPVNWHNDVELIFCIKGELDIRINDEMCKGYPGNIYVFNSQVMHNVTSDTYGAYMVLIISEDFCNKCFIDITKTQFRPFIEFDPDIEQGFLLLEKHFQTLDTERAIGVTKAVSDILYVLYTKFLSPQSPERLAKSTSRDRVKTIITYLNRHYDENITLDLLVTLVNLNKYQLIKEFKRDTGLTVLQYLNMIRCRAAKNMMKDGMLASEAAYQCGFTTPSYFSKVFTKIMGKPPSYYTTK